MVDSHAENYVIKENWYDLTPYRNEIRKYIVDQKLNLGHHSRMYDNYDILYRSIFSGSETSDEERYTTAKESYNVYKAALIEGCVPGYSALMDIEGRNAHSVELAPKLKKTMISQFKNITLVEKISDVGLCDWILKGEVAAFIKLKQTTEKFREKETVTDAETGEKILQFKVETGVTYEDLDIEFVDPLDVFIDANDYQKDPKGCPKIIRSFITSSELLTNKTDYKLLTDEDKQDIIQKVDARVSGQPYTYADPTFNDGGLSESKSNGKQIEVYTYRGNYVTKDGKLLTNIKAIVVEGKLSFLDYSGVDSLQFVYAAYNVDRTTHRGVSPLASVIPLNRLANNCIDLFVKNLDEVANPIMMYPTGTFAPNSKRNLKEKRELEYNNLTGGKIDWYAPPQISPVGMDLINVILQQNKDTLGLNKYISGDTSGSVRTAQESAILFQKANARMRVETDVFSYKFLLPLMVAFYSMNRELALGVGHPLEDIYADPELMVSISTGASKADREGERMRLMELLNLPIAQMFASSLQPNQILIALRYLMAANDVTDLDNLLELFDKAGNPTYLQEEGDEGVNTQVDNSPAEQMALEENNQSVEGDIAPEGADIMLQAYNNELNGGQQ